MAFDKTKPQGSDKLRVSDEYIRANWTFLEDAIGRDHEFNSGELGAPAGNHNAVTLIDQSSHPASPAGNTRLFYNIGGVLYTQDNAGKKERLRDIPAGSKMLFKNTAAPAGWTFKAEDNDRVLINTSTAADGGTTGGSWTISGISVNGHTLTISEMPNHTHSLFMKTGYADNGIGTEGFYIDDLLYNGLEHGTGSTTTSSKGGGSAHSHGLTIANTWRPSYAKVITCQKD